MARTSPTHRLSNVTLNEISFVGKGDNKDAHIVLLKNHPSTILALGKNYKGKDKVEVLEKWFKETDKIKKDDGDAKLFADIANDKAVRDKIWSIVWMLEDSVSSIMCDEAVTDKAGMIQQSVDQFKEAATTLTKGDDSMTKEELEKEVETLKKENETLKAKQAAVDAEDAADGGADDSEENPDGSKKKKTTKAASTAPAPGEKCPTCGQTMPMKKEAAIDKSALPEAVVKQLEAIEKENADNRAAIEKMKDEAVSKECVEKAGKVSAVGKAEDVTGILKEASKVSKEFGDKIFELLKVADARIKEGGLFKEIGIDNGSTDTAVAKIEKAAEELRKANPKLSKEQAWSQVYESNTELRKAYITETRG